VVKYSYLYCTSTSTLEELKHVVIKKFGPVLSLINALKELKN